MKRNWKVFLAGGNRVRTIGILVLYCTSAQEGIRRWKGKLILTVHLLVPYDV